MHVTYVTNNFSVATWYHDHPAAFLAFLADVHRHGIAISFTIASGPGIWLDHGRFYATKANRLFARTDLNHDGVSDLDGRLDVLYQGHEVLEWATHAQRVAIYRATKKWFPTTPVSVYYAGFNRPFDPAQRNLPHPSGRGIWADYAYGPGEADIVHLGIPRMASDETATARALPHRPPFDPVAFAAAVRRSAQLVWRQTPGMPIVVSTSFGNDNAMRASARSMWTPTEITAWVHALSGVPGIRGMLLRSYGRFRYDLANSAWTAQRTAFTRAAAAAAARGQSGPAG